MDKELLLSYNILTSKISVLRAQAREQAKQIVQEGTKSYFEKYGHLVEQIFWNQYTPWFNDGDACEFGADEPKVVLYADEDEDKYTEGSRIHVDIASYEEKLADWAKFNENPEAYRDAVESASPGIFHQWRPRSGYFPHYENEDDLRSYIEQANSYPKGFAEDTNALLSFIASLDEDMLEELFDNHVTVRITATGIETEEYSHE